MKTYNCIKQVQAAKILDILVHDGGATLTTDSGRESVPAYFIHKHSPDVGGYIVRYADGYTSYSPADVFEAGYLESASGILSGVYMRDISKYKGQPDGHFYALRHLGNEAALPSSREDMEQLQFICKRPKVGGAPGELETVAEGTTNEAVMEVLIDRMQKLYDKFPSEETKLSIRYIQEALRWQEIRTAKRKAAGVEGKQLHVPGERVPDPKLYGVSVVTRPTEEPCGDATTGDLESRHLLNDVPAMSLHMPSAVVAEGFCRMLDAHRENAKVFSWPEGTEFDNGGRDLGLADARMLQAMVDAISEQDVHTAGTLITSRKTVAAIIHYGTGKPVPPLAEGAALYSLRLKYDDTLPCGHFRIARCVAAQAQLNTAACICAANEPSAEDRHIISTLLAEAEKAERAEDNPQAVS